MRCHYDHWCAYKPCGKFSHSYKPCGKFSHSILNCRKLAADREKVQIGKTIQAAVVQMPQPLLNLKITNRL